MSQSATITPRWLTRKGARTYCGLSIPTLDRRIREGVFASRTVGRVRLIDRESLDRWIEGQPGEVPPPGG